MKQTAHSCKPEKQHLIYVIRGDEFRAECGPKEPKLKKGESLYLKLQLDTMQAGPPLRNAAWDALCRDNEIDFLVASLRAYAAVCTRLGVFERDNNWDPYQHTAWEPSVESLYKQLADTVTEVIGDEAGQQQRFALSKEGRETWSKKPVRKSKPSRPDPELKKLQPLAIPKTQKSASLVEMAARTVALVLTFSGVGNRRKVSTTQIEVAADKEWIAVSKKLLDAEELQAIQSLDGEARRYVEARALPSMLKKGVYLLPIEFVEEVSVKLTDYEARRKALVIALVNVYDRLIEQARGRLKGLFSAGDYPTAEHLRDAFRLTWRFIAFNTPASLQQVNREIYERERKKAEEMWREAGDTIQKVLRESMADLVDHMVNILTPAADGKRKIFRDSSIGKVQEFLQMFDSRNITNDAQLKTVVDRARELLKGIDADYLRDSETVRDYVRGGFATIKKAIEPMVETKPLRAITFEEG